MKKVIFFVLLAITMRVNVVFAEEKAKGGYHFPAIEPEATAWIGHSYVDLDGSRTAGEYQYFPDDPWGSGSDIDDSLAAGGMLTALPFPHRIHLEGEMNGPYDRFGDFRYAYGETMISRWVTRGLYHNLENITLVPYISGTSGGVEIFDAGDEYGIRTDISKFNLTVKTPEYPAYVYTEAWFVDKDGTDQLRFIGGTGYHSNNKRVSSRQDVDWNTKEQTIGAKAHAGYLEADLSVSERSFDPGNDDVAVYTYTAAGGRAAGTYEHSRVPQLEAETDTVRLHTNYTGRMVASATLSKISKKNNYSGTAADYHIGQGEVSFSPITRLALIGKYRHEETDITNPETFTLINQATGAVVAGYPKTVKDPLRSTKDKLTLGATYHPSRLKGTTLRGECAYEQKERKDTDADTWNLPTSSSRRSYMFSAASRLPHNAKMKAKYSYQETSQEKRRPANDFEPKYLNDLDLSLSWAPIPFVSSMLGYVRSKDETHEYQYDDGGEIADADHRERLRQRFLAGVTVCPVQNVSITPSYSQIRTEIQQDILYHDSSGNPFVEDDVDYESKAHNYAAHISYVPADAIDLSAGVDYTTTHAEFYPKSDIATLPIGIGPLTIGDTDELSFSLEGTYELSNGWGLGLRYSFTDFNDHSADNPQSGDYQSTTIMLSKKW